MGGITTIKQDLFNESQYPLHRLGQLAIDEWGSKFRYVQNGGSSALVTGNLLQEPAEVTNFQSMVCAATAAIGAEVVKVDLGGTAVTANQFDGGELVIESSTGVGQWFRILSHDVQTSTTGECDFVIDRPLKIGITVDTSQVSVRINSYDGVVQYPTTPTGGAVGVALYAMTVSYHGWVVSGGDAVVLMDNQENTAADQTALKPSEDVAGSVAPRQEADVASPTVGHARQIVSVDTTMSFAHLTLD